MSPINKLIELGMLCWSTLLLGLNKGWATRKDAIDYAVSLLVNGSDDEDVAIIAGGETLSDDELFSLISKKVDGTRSFSDFDKWRLAHLLCVAESNDDEQGKLDKLQEVYAAFDYPEDMASCSIYSQDDTNPIVAMMRGIEELRSRISP